MFTHIHFKNIEFYYSRTINYLRIFYVSGYPLRFGRIHPAGHFYSTPFAMWFPKFIAKPKRHPSTRWNNVRPASKTQEMHFNWTFQSGHNNGVFGGFSVSPPCREREIESFYQLMHRSWASSSAQMYNNNKINYTIKHSPANDLTVVVVVLDHEWCWRFYVQQDRPSTCGGCTTSVQRRPRRHHEPGRNVCVSQSGSAAELQTAPFGQGTGWQLEIWNNLKIEKKVFN